MPSRRSTAVALVVLPLALWSCASDDETPNPRPTTTTLSPEAEVEAAYLAYWDMVDRLTATPVADSPEVAEHTADPARDQLLTSIASLHEAGHSVEGGEQTRHEISNVTVDGERAELRDCYVDDSVTIDVSSGTTLEDRLATDLLEVKITRSGGDWLTSEVNVLGSWDGVVPCDG